MYKIFFTFISILFIGCGTSKRAYLTHPEQNENNIPLPDIAVKHRLYLIGDAGGFNEKDAEVNYVFQKVRERISNDDAEKSIVFLGDNIYEEGLAKKESDDRKRTESILQAHLDLAEDNDANLFIIPGNHDWYDNKKGGLSAIQRQYEYVSDHRISKDRVKFYPKDGCGDPEAVEINKDLVFIFFDSQWWVHDWSSEVKINKGCSIKSRREFLDKMRDLIIEYKNDQIVLCMHHPFISNGNHGGNFSAQDHLFPLTKVHKYAYLPMPFIGSLYPLYRQLGGTNQDNTHYLLRELRKELEHTIRWYDASRVMFVSGHDHFLQHTAEQFFFQKFPIHYVISGSGYKKGYAARGYDANYVVSKRGYTILTVLENGSTWLDFYTLSDDGMSETLAYRTEIYTADPAKEDFIQIREKLTTPAPIVSLPPNPKFKRTGFYRFIMGKQYRETWTTPVAAPVFSLQDYKGGLTPVKKGGGLFSRTLRLENEEGHDYVLRSVNKDFYKAVPDDLKSLEILKLYADQNTSSIPYGALYISALSKHANIYHTNPELVCLRDTEELGPFQEYFPEGYYLLEERPDGDWREADFFGNSKKIIGYNDLLSILRKKSKHMVDQKWALRSRLFDIWIHDRDRHDDQWRWAEVPDGEKTLYRPIPRDRDWAFFKYGGVLPSFIGNVADKKLKSMSDDCIDVKSLAFNANNFDRYFLNELTWADWQEQIRLLQNSMTDEAIESSLEAMPYETREYVRSELVHKLKKRRDILERDVKKYYDFITKEVEITGTDDEDVISIEQLANGDTRITVYTISSEEEKIKRYDRTLLKSETNEIRIYGLAGKDKFEVSSNGKGHATLRIIGGIGDDELAISSTGSSSKVDVYDSYDGITVSDMSLIHDHRDDDHKTNEYDRLGFMYDTGLPWLNLGYAPDDGLIVGVGFQSIKHSWRKSPFHMSHFFNLEATPYRGFGLDVEYEGEVVSLFGKKWGLFNEVFLETPDYINYFELGSDSNNSNRRSKYNWVRRSSFGASSKLITRRADNHIRWRIGPAYESHDLNPERGSILLDLDEFDKSDFDRTHFVGLETDIRIHTLDRLLKPSKGFLINAFLKHQYDINNKNHTLKMGGSISFYVPLSPSHDITFGSNTGYQKIVGDPLFYQYPSMGSKRYLRPFRSHRFRGESILYQQLDLRFKLVQWNNTILPMTIGGVGGYDFGQDYYKGQDTGDIKHGWSAGLWFDLLDLFLLRTSLSGSKEGTYFIFDVGFAF